MSVSRRSPWSPFLAVSVFVGLAGCAQVRSIVLQKPDATRLTGIWEGTHSCGPAPTGVTLSMSGTDTGQVTAVLDFHATPENPQLAPGRYTMRGNFTPAGALVLRPDTWVARPGAAAMVGFNGKVDILTIGYEGKVPECGRPFQLSKVKSGSTQAPPPPVQATASSPMGNTTSPGGQPPPVAPPATSQQNLAAQPISPSTPTPTSGPNSQPSPVVAPARLQQTSVSQAPPSRATAPTPRAGNVAVTPATPAPNTSIQKAVPLRKADLKAAPKKEPKHKAVPAQEVQRSYGRDFDDLRARDRVLAGALKRMAPEFPDSFATGGDLVVFRLDNGREILLSGGWTSFAEGNTPYFVAYERKQALLAYVTDGGKNPELNGTTDAELCALLVGEVAKAIKSGDFYLQDARTMEIEQNAGN
jgi:hypothetical protein